MSDQQEQSYNEDNTQALSNDAQQADVCEKCGQNPCVCPNDEDLSDQKQVGEPEVSQEEPKEEGDRKPPKIRWI